jgi:dihydroorotate dehydrogenase (NAD+) catalytic subunit
VNEPGQSKADGEDAHMDVSVGSLQLHHPFMLGSGPIGVRAEDLIAYGKVAGAIITKSISAKPSRGSPQPRIVKIDRDGMINYEGGPNPGIEAFAATLREVRPQIACPIIGSISPRTLTHSTGIENVTEQFVAAGADAIELDFKYVYDEQKGKAEFQPENMASVVRRARSAANVPIIAKLAFGSIPLDALARAAEDGGATAISAINTIFPAMRISPRSRRPMLSMQYGGLSGAPIRSLAVAAIFRLRQATNLPLIGIGGIVDAADAAEFFLAGANAVQVYTAAQIRGPEIFDALAAEMPAILAEMGAASLTEIVGAAHRAVPRRQEDHQWDAVAADEA